MTVMVVGITGLQDGKQCAYCFRRYCADCQATSPAIILEYQWDVKQVQLFSRSL